MSLLVSEATWGLCVALGLSAASGDGSRTASDFAPAQFSSGEDMEAHSAALLVATVTSVTGLLATAVTHYKIYSDILATS